MPCPLSVMRNHLNHDLGSRWGTISNLHGFMMRHFDTGFKSKWSGFWVPPYKFLDYYSIKVNGVWLNSNTVRGVEYGDGMVFHHEAGSLRVEETVSMPDSLPGFRIELEIFNTEQDRKAVHTIVEPAVDIRGKSQDVVESGYSIEKKDNRLTVARDGKKLMITSEEGIETRNEPYEKEHFPGERQVAMIPGQIVFRRELEGESRDSFSIEFTTSDASFGSIEASDTAFQNQSLGQTFQESVRSMENMVYDQSGKGLLAGHPWFQNYWARDTYWTLLGLIDAGHFELSHEILENFANREGFPNMIPLEDREPGPNADAAPLFVIAADKLERHWKTSEKIKKKQREAMKLLEHENGVVKHDPEGTWMDTLERAPAIEIQALWLEAAKIIGHGAEKELESGLREFETQKGVKDVLQENPARTINAAVPLMLGQFKEEKAYDYLEELNAEFSSRFGARTRAVTDPGYDSGGYHTGSVWGLTTGWASAANFRYGKNTHGKNFLEKMTQFLNRNQIGGLPEVVHAENGDLLGCGEQAWSAGMFAHVIDTYYLGIEVQESNVKINPSANANGKRLGKRIGDEKIDLKFEDGEVEVLNSPDIELIVW